MPDTTIKDALDFADSVALGGGESTTWAQRQLEAQLHTIRLLARIVALLEPNDA